MPRSLDTTLSAALANSNVQPVILAIITFASGTVYVWSGVGNLIWNGNTYLGVGSLGNISAITEGSGIEAQGVTLTLSGVPLTSGTQVYIPATAAPWTPGLPGNNATNYNFGYNVSTNPGNQLPWDATAPIVVPMTLNAGETLTITAFGSVTPNDNAKQLGPGSVAVGPAGGFNDSNGYPGGPYGGEIWGYYASTCLPGVVAPGPVGAGGLMGAFTDSEGNVIQPVAIGTKVTLGVPAGATRLQLGINDNIYEYNSGAFTATVSAQGSIPLGSTILTEALSDIQIGAAAKVYFGLFSNGALLGTPYLAFGGQVDQPKVKVSPDTLTISLALENRLVNLQRASQRRYTSADQHIEYPTDTGFNWVETLNDIALIWR